MFESISCRFHRYRELGVLGTIQHSWIRIKDILFVWGQSLWWGFWSRREMSDAALLAHTVGNWMSVDSLLDHLIKRPASSYLLPHESQEDTISLLNHYYPQHVSTLIDAANAACQNEISLLSQVFHYPQGIEWHCDPVTRKRWPLFHRSRMSDVIWSTPPSDYIYIWELNRHQHFINLGIAYWLTGDDKYVNAFCTQFISWIEANPVQHGINWYSCLEISLRLIAWVVAFQFFRTSSKFQERVGAIFLKSLWQQVDFLSSHLQNTESDTPNNHFVGELVGMILVGSVFPEFNEAASWRETGLNLLNQQVLAQTHSDGVNKEQSTAYHHLVVEELFLVVILSRHGILSDVPILEDTLERMLDYVLYSLTPNGTVPMWGDSSFIRTLGLGKNKDFWDFRPILSAGAVLFDRADWKFAARRFDEEAFWLLGFHGLDLWENLDVHPPVQTSKDFPDAGMYIMRDSWTSDTDIAFFRCGVYGLGDKGPCSHSHSDLLSFVLWMGGQPLLEDSGTYSYHGYDRDLFRLTTAHNTVLIDCHDQALPKPHFGWQQIPSAKCISLSENRVSGELTNFDKVRFVRELSHARSGIWEVDDNFLGHFGTHELSWFFHFSAGLDLQWIDISNSMIVKRNNKPFVVVFSPKGVNVEILNSWISYSYGIKQSNMVLHGIWKGEIPESGINFCWKFSCLDKDIEVIQ